MTKESFKTEANAAGRQGGTHAGPGESKGWCRATGNRALCRARSQGRLRIRLARQGVWRRLAPSDPHALTPVSGPTNCPASSHRLLRYGVNPRSSRSSWCVLAAWLSWVRGPQKDVGRSSRSSPCCSPSLRSSSLAPSCLVLTTTSLLPTSPPHHTVYATVKLNTTLVTPSLASLSSRCCLARCCRYSGNRLERAPLAYHTSL
jgi:hypothetical protein